MELPAGRGRLPYTKRSEVQGGEREGAVTGKVGARRGRRAERATPSSNLLDFNQTKITTNKTWSDPTVGGAPHGALSNSA
jgi:hypothetical protein